MRQIASVCLMLVTSISFAAAADFRLGLTYAEWGPYLSTVRQIATDSSGALYILASCTPDTYSPSCLTKLAADGKTILWQNTLAFRAAVWAVDPQGGVYLIPGPPSGTPAVYPLVIEKLSADGATVLWKTQISDGATGYDASLAVDASGRVFIAGAGCSSPFFPRLNTAGAIDATFPNVPARPISLAVSPSGADIVIGSYVALHPDDQIFTATYGLLRLAPDLTTWLTVRPPRQITFAGLAVAPNGDAVVYGSEFPGNRSLQRIDRTGGVVFSNSVLSQPAAGSPPTAGALALDAAGNAYITGYTGPFGIPTRNSLAPCGSTWMSVYAPDGTTLETTYLPGATNTALANPLIVLSPGSGLFVVAIADTKFTPTQNGPFPQFPYGADLGSTVLLNLSPNAAAQTMPLACVASAYTFGSGAVAPGELVALYGNRLGPLQGVQTSATLQSPFPTQAGGVEVTFDGVPAPVLWVQDSQINAAVPWSVAGPTTQICVKYNKVKTNCLTWPVTVTAPGVLTVDGTYAAAVNQDGTLNSALNPAPPNSIVAIFATGLGSINVPQTDGSLINLPLPVNVYPVTLGVPFRIGLVSAMSSLPANYAGPAPFQIAGTSQINFNSNDMLASGSNSYLYLQVQTPSGTVLSNAFRIYVAGQ